MVEGFTCLWRENDDLILCPNLVRTGGSDERDDSAKNHPLTWRKHESFHFRKHFRSNAISAGGLTGCVVHDRYRREEVVVVEERPRREIHVDEDRRREVIIEERPPEARVEFRSESPSREHVWLDGHYVRVGNH